MRTVTTSMNTYLNSKFSTSPILVIGVNWAGIEVFYSDSDVNGARTRIVDSGEVYDMIKVVQGGSAKSFNVTLEDDGNDLKDIIDTVDIMMQPCNVYLLFDGLSLDDKILLFSGNIASPVVWDHSSRSLSFSVMTDLDKIDAGFIVDEGKFSDLPEDVESDWPICFGEVCVMSPALVRSPLQGVLVSDTGIADPSLPTRLCQAKELQCPVVQIATSSNTSLSDGLYSDEWWHKGTITDTPIYAPDASCVQKRYDEICNIIKAMEDQYAEEDNTITIVNGNKFPQGQRITLNIEEAKLVGTFSGNTFTIRQRIHPDYEELANQVCVNIPGENLKSQNLPRSSTRYAIDDQGQATRPGDTTNRNDLATNVSVRLPDDYECDSTDYEPQIGIYGGTEDSWSVYNSLKSGSLHTIAAGSKVFIDGDHKRVFVVSLVPGTITSVAAYKTNLDSNRTFLVEIPADWYTVSETNYGGYTSTEITLLKQPSIEDETWEDDIYVSFVSSVGPNPVDIISWLVEKYSDYTLDSTSFTQVKNYLTNYPCNFVLHGKKDLFDLINDIAYQSRCELTVRNKTIYITYLSRTPTPVGTIDSSKVFFDTLKLSLSDSDDLVTKYTVKWSKLEVPLEKDTQNETEYTLTLKHNVGTYGLHEGEDDYYTLSTYSTILKTATFWLIRKANSWKQLELTGPLSLLPYEYNDCVIVDLPDFSSQQVRCLVKNTSFDPVSNNVTLELWTPVKCGTTEEYFWAWPATKAANAVFPIPGEDAGPAYAFEVIPPADHILASDETVILSTGDPHPSDIGDTFPDLYCFSTGAEDIEREDTIQRALDLANASYVNSLMPRIPNVIAYQEALDKLPSSSGNSAIPGVPCTFTVTASYITPTQVGTSSKPCSFSGEGMPCGGETTTHTHKFVNYAGAQTFRTQILQRIAYLNMDGGHYVSGDIEPTSIGNVVVLSGGSSCTDPATTSNYYFYQIESPRES